MRLFSKLDSRLGTDAVWGWSFARYAATVLAFLTFVFDVAGLNSRTWLWAVVALISFTESCALVYVARKTFLKQALETKPRAWLNLSVIAFVGAAHNLTDSTLASWLGIGPPPVVSYQLIAGGQMGFYILLFYGITVGARVEHFRLLDALNLTTSQLTQITEKSSDRLAAAEEDLAEEARQALLPKLAQLQSLADSKLSSVNSVSQFRSVLNEHVRPFTRDMQNRALNLSGLAEAVTAGVRKHPRSYLGQGVPFRNFLLPGAITILTASSAWAIAYLVMGQPEAGKLGFAALLNYPLVWLARRLTPKHWSISDGAATIIIVLLGITISVIPLSAGFSDAHPGDPHWLLWMIPIVFIGELLILAEGIGLDHYRGLMRERVEVNNTEIRRQLTLFEQKLWLARRKWQFTIHGSVQGALTAALVRLSRADSDTQEALSLVQADVQRAIDALVDPTIETVDLQDAAKQLAESWEGVCEVSVSFGEGVLQPLNDNLDTASCVNEVMKEVVNNAVRYSNAKGIRFRISREGEKSVAIESVNDSEIRVSEIGTGVGTELLDELTAEWSVRNVTSGLVLFKATVPIG